MRISIHGAASKAKFHAAVQDDELVEVTPKSIRLRKSLLDPQAHRAPQGGGRSGVKRKLESSRRRD